MIKEINGVQHAINEKIENFSIKSMPSSNVAFYGVSHDLGNKQIFVQFKNGSSYIYSNLTDDNLKALSECDSIGKFVSSHLTKIKKEDVEKCDCVLVVPIIETVQSVGRLNRLVRNSQSTDVYFIEVNENGDLTEPTF